MTINQTQIRLKLEQLETSTVSNSFGGNELPGRAPNFEFTPIFDQISEDYSALDSKTSAAISKIAMANEDALNYIIRAAGRFAFCIELTNLKITSTKMKTRWMPGNIIKTRPGSYQNFPGLFAPHNDVRASNFEECFDIFRFMLEELAESPEHLKIMAKLKKTKCRGIPYESVFGYKTFSTEVVHSKSNVKLVSLEDITWLINARPIIYPILNVDSSGNRTKVVNKIKTKAYKTDRSQTGEVQTNRAKRWECLSLDFQHAPLEDCWSVERSLLTDICNFEEFPSITRDNLINKKLLDRNKTTYCPITFISLSFRELLNGGAHGKSKFQVGHMDPLKSGGKHSGQNIAWISDDGNRIQGSLTITETKEMLVGIVDRMNAVASK